MAKEKTESGGGFFSGLLHVGLYKRQQGRMARQVTCAAIVVVMAFAAWRMSLSLQTFDWFAGLCEKLRVQSGSIGSAAILFSGLFFALTAWIGYRIVNYPPFADFLISVEAEMNKVSWPSKDELTRSSFVVLFTVIFLAISLYVFDTIWSWLFSIVFSLGS